MPIEKRKTLAAATIHFNAGVVEVKEINEIVEDGTVIHAVPHRRAFTLDEYEDLLELHPRVGALAERELAWTPLKAKAAKAAKEAAREKLDKIPDQPPTNFPQVPR
jgi:hypothetical protein